MITEDISLSFEKYKVKNIQGHYEFYYKGSNIPFMSCDIGELNETIEELKQEMRTI